MAKYHAPGGYLFLQENRFTCYVRAVFTCVPSTILHVSFYPATVYLLRFLACVYLLLFYPLPCTCSSLFPPLPFYLGTFLHCTVLHFTCYLLPFNLYLIAFTFHPLPYALDLIP